MNQIIKYCPALGRSHRGGEPEGVSRAADLMRVLPCIQGGSAATSLSTTDCTIGTPVQSGGAWAATTAACLAGQGDGRSRRLKAAQGNSSLIKPNQGGKFLPEA